jgi:plastocyanin
MRVNIRRGWALRPLLGAAGLLSLAPSPQLPASSVFATRDARLATLPRLATLTGHLTLLEKDNKQSEHVGQAVVWLSATRPVSMPPAKAEINTADKQFSPHVIVVPVGSSVSFPNHDPFNHNVFSLSEENPFDLGLYGRGETPAVRFAKPEIVRVYCNVHSQMSALVVVRDNPWYGQPSSDGSFTIEAVPPGRYTLHAWHERSPPIERELVVPESGVSDLELELDARGYKFKPHLNKFGRPYPQQGRCY